MTSITIYDIDESMETLIRKRAKEEGLSLNKTIKKLLKQALGLNNNKPDNNENYSNLFGTWDEKDVKAFQETIREFEQMDMKKWK